MKLLTITFFLSIISVFSFAQTPFTEQTLLDMNKRMMQDYPKFMTEEVSTDYTFTTEDGALIPYQTMKDFKIKVLEWNTHDLKIKQIGNAAIVRGINKNTIQSATSGAIRKYNLQFIYTYEYKNGKWMWFSSHHIYNYPSKEEEEALVKKALIEERMALLTGNKEALAKLWKEDPKAFNTASYSNGGYHYIGGEGIKKALADVKPNPLGKIPEVTNARISIKGNIAIVDFDQTNTNRDGRKGYEHNISILEKVDNDWKLIGHSGHGVMQKDDVAEDALKMFVSEYNKDAISFFKDRCSDNFRYTNEEGKFINKEQLLSNKTHTSNSEISDLKVIQNGFLAVINGIHTWKDDSNKVNRKVAFTYTLQKISNKWMYVASQQTPVKE